jgi:NAD+ kinase
MRAITARPGPDDAIPASADRLRRKPDRPKRRRRARASPSATATPRPADVIVALGGDGLMLQTLHRFMRSGKPIYGMHRGTVGFLMNEFREDDLRERLAARADHADPSAADARTRRQGKRARASRHQRGLAVPPDLSGGALRILIDGKERLPS